jgi:hypothetical protein
VLWLLRCLSLSGRTAAPHDDRAVAYCSALFGWRIHMSGRIAHLLSSRCARLASSTDPMADSQLQRLRCDRGRVTSDGVRARGVMRPRSCLSGLECSAVFVCVRSAICRPARRRRCPGDCRDCADLARHLARRDENETRQRRRGARSSSTREVRRGWRRAGLLCTPDPDVRFEVLTSGDRRCRATGGNVQKADRSEVGDNWIQADNHSRPRPPTAQLSLSSYRRSIPTAGTARQPAAEAGPAHLSSAVRQVRTRTRGQCPKTSRLLERCVRTHLARQLSLSSLDIESSAIFRDPAKHLDSSRHLSIGRMVRCSLCCLFS